MTTTESVTKASLAAYAVFVANVLRQDYGHDICVWPTTAMAWAADFIHDAHIDEMPLAECAWSIANEYGKPFQPAIEEHARTMRALRG